MKTIKEHIIELEGYLESKDLFRGFTENINGKNFCDEMIHGTRDYGGSRFGFLATDEFLCWGNDTAFFEWKSFLQRWVGSPMSGDHRVANTTYWGVGTSFLTCFAFGVPDFMLVYDSANDKYLMRRWEYEVEIKDEDFFGKQVIKKLSKGKLVIQEYELSREEYLEVAPQDFDFIPNFYFQIRKFINVDVEKEFNGNDLVNSIDLTTLFNSGNLHQRYNYVWVKIGDSKKYYSRQRYLPIIGEDNQPVKSLNQVPVYKTIDNIPSYPGLKINVRIGKRPCDKDFDRTNYELFQQLKNRNNIEVYPLSGVIRGDAPLHLWVDDNLSILPRYNAWRLMKKELGILSIPKNWTRNTICIFEVVEFGESFEFNAIKSTLPRKDIVDAMCVEHVNVVEQNTDLHYDVATAEDTRVQMYINNLVDGGKYKGNVMESISHLTDDELSRKEIRNEDNHEQNEKHNKREWDWLIFDDNGRCILHQEWMLNKEDWDHVDQLFNKTGRTIGGKCAPYHVLVVGEFAGTASKRKDMRKHYADRTDELNEKGIKKIWILADNDFKSGNTNKFKLIWETTA